MKRRRVLATVGLGVTTATAGCLSRFDAPTEENDPNEPSEKSAPNATEPTSVAAGETVERDPGDGTLGDGRRSPHAVFVTNPTETTRTVALAIEQGGSTVFEESFAVDPEGTAKVSIRRLATYTVEATVDESGETETTTVERAQFDCNATSVQLELQADGTLSSATLSTMMACGNVVTERVASRETVEHTVSTVDDSDEMRGRHTVRVSNPTDRTWTARVILGDGERAQFDGLFAVEPDAAAEVHFDRRDSDTIDARVLDTEASESVTLDESNIGACNAATSTFELTDDGALKTSTISTDLACHPDDA